MDAPIKVYLHTISTNKTHPDASEAVLTAPALQQPGVCFVRIVEDVIGLFFWLQNPGLIIWDWRTGVTAVVCPSYVTSCGSSMLI